MLDVILVSNYSMKEELEQALLKSSIRFHDLMIQDIHHIERYPIKDEYKTIIIQSANAIKKSTRAIIIFTMQKLFMG